MAKVAPFHSKRPSDRNVYHDNSRCTQGNNIEPRNKVSGTDGRPKCDHCKRLGYGTNPWVKHQRPPRSD